MIKNYFIIAFRNLLKTKNFTVINVSGLAVGMATTVLIAAWIYSEVRFDRFHVNKKNIYQVWNRGTMDGKLQCWPNTPKILAPTLRNEFAEVNEVARTFTRWFVTITGDRKISTQALITDPAFLKIFSFPLATGDVNTVLSNSYSIVVTKKMAFKTFDHGDAMGKEIKIDNELYRVTGILEDLPTNTDFNFEYLLSWDYMRRTGEDDLNWANNGILTYVMLNDGMNGDQVNAKIKDVTIRHSNGIVKEEIFLHPLDRWHLYSRFENGVSAGGRIEIVQLFGFIGVIVLVVACINFMNLTTARSEKRAKEVGVRKAAGAGRDSLIWQFLIESIAMAAVAGIISIVLVQAALPYFNMLIGQSVGIPLMEPEFWLSFFVFIILTGLIAGSYPAFFLSSFRPVLVLKGTFKKSTSHFNIRKVLVVSQFSFAVVLIISTLVVVEQVDFTKSRERGYESEHLIYHWITGDLDKNYPALKNELIQSGVAASVTKTLSPFTMITSDTWGLEWQGKHPDDKTDFERLSADEHVVQTASLTLVQGRDLDLKKYPSDSTGMLVNEAAVKAFGFKDPIGQTIRETDGTVYHIVGVVRDFITGSPDQSIKPLIMGGVRGNGFNVINIKLSTSLDTRDAIAKVQRVFQKYNSAYPFEFHFADEDYSRKFDDARRTATLVSVFTVLTIFVSCLGLFGLATYMAEMRVKEIGIRKVLGASVVRITTLVAKDFLSLVIIAIVIGTPLAWYLMGAWLQEFAYRTTMGWPTFVAAGVLCITLAIVTVSYQAIKAAMEDPVKSLRNE
jgi:putative ABC transport system permease protein